MSSKVGKSPSKVWLLKYRLHGKENRFSIGAYPDIGLKRDPAIERPADLGRFLIRLDDCNDGSVAAAMRLLVMLPVRPSELVQMRSVPWRVPAWERPGRETGQSPQVEIQ